MTNTEFAAEQKSRLASYKEDVLGVTRMGQYEGREYPHILPDEGRALNFLDTIRGACWDYLSNTNTRPDSGLSHLNSSQGLAFNFWFPSTPGDAPPQKWGVFARLCTFLGWEDIEIETAEFEAKRNVNENTNIDWWAEAANGTQIFCEVKYTEPFGTAKDNSTYRKQLKEVYEEELAPLLGTGTLDDFEFFRTNYQILRNIWHLHHGMGPEGNRVLFLLPARSPSLSKLEAFIEKAIPPGTVAHERVSVATLEKAALYLLGSSSCLEEERHWRLFLLKYCPWALSDQTIG